MTYESFHFKKFNFQAWPSHKQIWQHRTSKLVWQHRKSEKKLATLQKWKGGKIWKNKKKKKKFAVTKWRKTEIKKTAKSITGNNLIKVKENSFLHFDEQLNQRKKGKERNLTQNQQPDDKVSTGLQRPNPPRRDNRREFTPNGSFRFDLPLLQGSFCWIIITIIMFLNYNCRSHRDVALSTSLSLSLFLIDGNKNIKETKSKFNYLLPGRGSGLDIQHEVFIKFS